MPDINVGDEIVRRPNPGSAHRIGDREVYIVDYVSNFHVVYNAYRREPEGIENPWIAERAYSRTEFDRMFEKKPEPRFYAGHAYSTHRSLRKGETAIFRVYEVDDAYAYGVTEYEPTVGGNLPSRRTHDRYADLVVEDLGKF